MIYYKELLEKGNINSDVEELIKKSISINKNQKSSLQKKMVSVNDFSSPAMGLLINKYGEDKVIEIIKKYLKKRT